MEFSLNGAELSLNSVNSGNSKNLRNHWSMNWVQYKDLLCCLCLCGLVVSSLSFTQEILGSSPTLPFSYFINFFLSLNSANSVTTFRENSNGFLRFCYNLVLRKSILPNIEWRFLRAGILSNNTECLGNFYIRLLQSSIPWIQNILSVQ